MLCPKCGKQCVAEFVDNGVGYQQCGPYVCLPDNGGCGWAEQSCVCGGYGCSHCCPEDFIEDTPVPE